MNNKIFILDFETTGLNVFHDDITEYCIKELESGYSKNSFVQLKNKKSVSKFITEKTGITTEMTESGESQDVAIRNLVNFIDSHTVSTDTVYLVAHNGDSFDFPILRRLMKEYNVKPRCLIKYFDTLRFAQILLPRNYYFNQATLCKLFGYKNEYEHRAMGDVDALIKIYKRLAKLYSSKKTTIEKQHEFVYSQIH